MPGVYVIGVALAPPALRHDESRLEELVYHTARGALDDAGVSRQELDSVTLASSDELDGRPISSMLLAAPAGAFLTDETRVTDCGASALCLGAARLLSGDFHLSMIASWCKPSKTDIAQVMNARAEPFFTRPLGLNATVADGLFAQAVGEELGISSDEVATRVVDAFTRAAPNPRGLGSPVPTFDTVSGSPLAAGPLRDGHSPPVTDGAACLVLASEEWLRRHPGHRTLARLAGVGWASDSYRLEAERLRRLGSARSAWATALRRAGLRDATELDVVELEAPTGFHEAAYCRAFGLDEAALSPSGGTFAQNPLFCTGLVNAVEAVLQVAGRAGPVQRSDVEYAAAHSCHGYAQQGNVVMVFERSGSTHG